MVQVTLTRLPKRQTTLNPKQIPPLLWVEWRLQWWHPELEVLKSKPLNAARSSPKNSLYWAAVKELNLSCYIGETILIIIYTHYGNSKKATQYITHIEALYTPINPVPFLSPCSFPSYSPLLRGILGALNPKYTIVVSMFFPLSQHNPLFKSKPVSSIGRLNL